MLAFAWTAAAWAAAEPELRFDALTQSVVATGLDPALLKALARDGVALRPAFGVFLGSAELPMLGDYEISQSAVRFTPRFPFLAGRAHRVQLDVAGLYRIAGLAAPAAEARPVTISFAVPDAPAKSPKTSVVSIFPSAEVLPANTLRFYVHFSGPMTRQAIAKHVRLERADGQPVKGAFLEMENGLWDPQSKRLTVFLHPGRIKRGLALHEREGQPLQPGNRYRLIVDAAAEDEDGQPLTAPFIKEFSATKEERTPPNWKQWKLDAPAAGSKDALALTADRPLDHALFDRVLQVTTADGRVVGGTVRVDEGETRWRFVPYSAWPAGSYLVKIAAELEDPAGNRPTRLFDEEIQESSHRDESREVAIPFQIR